MEAYALDLTQYCERYEHAMTLLGKRWTGLILRALLSGARRFGAICAYVPGLSDRLLSERLKELEVEGIVERRVFPDTPVRIEYVLTPKGRELREIVEAVQSWADQWIELSSLQPADSEPVATGEAPARQPDSVI